MKRAGHDPTNVSPRPGISAGRTVRTILIGGRCVGSSRHVGLDSIHIRRLASTALEVPQADTSGTRAKASSSERPGSLPVAPKVEPVPAEGSQARGDKPPQESTVKGDDDS